MAYSNPYLSGGGSSGFAWGNYKPPKKKKDDRKWYEKAVDKTVEVGGGVLGGLYETGKAAGHDVVVGNLDILEAITPLDNKDHDYRTDDIGRAIIDDYKSRYSSWDAWKSAWKTDPFAQVLDVLSVAAAFFTFGGSLAVRGAAAGNVSTKAARAAQVAEKAGNIRKAERIAYKSRVNKSARFAGLDVDNELTALRQRADDAFRKHGADSDEFLEALSEYEGKIVDVDARAKQAGARQSWSQRRTGNASRVKELDDGTVLSPRQLALRDNKTGIVVETIPAAPGAHRRAMQSMGASISNKYSNAALIGSNKRAGKIQNRVNRVTGENEGANVFAPAASAFTGGAYAYRKLSPEEEAATYLRSVLGEANENRLKGLAPDSPEAKAIKEEMAKKLDATSEFLGSRRRSLTGHSKEEFDAAMKSGAIRELKPTEDHIARLRVASQVDDELMDAAVKEAKRQGIDVEQALALGQPESILKPLADSGWLADLARNRRNLILHGETRYREIPDGKGGISYLDDYDVPSTLKEAEAKLKKLRLAKDARAKDFNNGAETVTRETKKDRVVGPVDSSGKNLKVLDDNGVPIKDVVSRTETPIKESLAELDDAIATTEQYITKLRMKEQAYRDVTRNLQQGYGKFDKSKQRRANLAKAATDPEYARKVLADIDARRELIANEDVMNVFMNPTKHMIRVEKSIGEATGTGVRDGYVTRVIKSISGDNGGPREHRPQMFAEMVLGRELTPEELERVNTWHHAQKAVRQERGRRPKTSKYVRPDKPRPSQLQDSDIPATTPKFTKYNTGYTFEFAQDMMSPKAVLKAYNEAQAFQMKMRVLQQVRKTGHPVRSLDEARELENTGSYYVVGPAGSSKELKGAAKMADMTKRVQDKLDNELRIIVGDNPVLDGIREELQHLGDLFAGKAGMVAVPKAYFDALAHEMKAADGALAKIVQAPTSLFRAATLNLRPAWIANNFVGQLLLLLYSQGVYHGTREYMSEINRTLGAKGALTEGKRAALASERDMIRRKAGALEHGAGAMRSELAATGKMIESSFKATDRRPNVAAAKQYKANRKAGMSKGEAWEKARRVTPGAPDSLARNTMALYLKRGTVGLTDAMGKINAILTDDMPRRAAFMSEVRPLLAAARKRADKRGLQMTDEQLMEVVLSDDKAVARLVDATMNDLIDFSRLSQAERDAIRPFLPFYSWMKGITLWTGRLVRDHPVAANVTYNAGKEYIAGAEERFNGRDVPDYVKGSIVIGHREDGTPIIRPVHGMNIFQTPADILDMATQGTIRRGDWQLGGLSPISQLNPTVKAPLEVLMGKDAFFGGPLYGRPEKGILNPGFMDNPWTDEDESRSRGAAAASRYLNSLGPIQLYNQYAQGQSSDYQTLLSRSNWQKFASYMGAPSADLNLDVAEERAGNTEQYGMVRYDPTKGETPGVFGRERPSTSNSFVWS